MKTYATPVAFKQALEQRLRTEVAGDGEALNRRRQLLVFDRFMARVVAVFADAVVLKGGLVLELRLARARTTKDVAPEAWEQPYRAMAVADALSWKTLDEVARATQTFLDSVLANNAHPTWSPQRWTWEAEAEQ